ncbi:MAG: hypothetical protein AAF665_01850 [Pseudomonadota bacterium]
MIVRFALFHGTLDDADRSDFDQHLRTRMLPLISAFPGLQSLRVLVPSEGDGRLAGAVLALEMTYQNRAAMEAALASPERARNAEETKALLAILKEPEVSHSVFEVNEQDVTLGVVRTGRHDTLQFPDLEGG